MPLFLSEEEFRQCSNDVALVTERADAFILRLRRQLETVSAEADAASIAAEQTCGLIEQKYTYIAAELSRIQAENAQITSSSEKRLSELAEVQAEKHLLHLKAIGKDGEIERLNVELSELHKSKRQALDLLEQKDVEIREKNATIQSYLDKIVNLTDSSSSREAEIHEKEADLARVRGNCDRLRQEKELIENHNNWLNEELTSKVNSLIELRKNHMAVEADMAAKIAELERQVNESSSLSKRYKERMRELEQRATSLEEDLCASKDAAATSEEGFLAEISTANKLTELYKASSDEWSKKAGELEGVIKALETHCNQVENDFKEKLEKEQSDKKEVEKELSFLKDKLDKCEAELENSRKASELNLLPLSNFHVDTNVEDINQMLVPRISEGISGTALAASLLRDGWSLVKMYEKFHETADALRHERWGRKNSESILERVLHEIEERADLLLEERAEHERMLEAYGSMNHKLQQALFEHENFENLIRQLKSELKKKERDYFTAEKEISDLQKQVSFLLKECQDIQFRCGQSSQVHPTYKYSIDSGPETEEIISKHLMTFKDINELVGQNIQLRSLVHNLTNHEEQRENELRLGFQLELQKATDDATAKVEAVLQRSEEQGRMIESLHSSVSMYKRLYEEERKARTLGHPPVEAIEEDGKRELMMLFEGSQEVSKKAHEQLLGRFRDLEEQFTKTKSELLALRLERDKLNLEANFSREKLDDVLKEMELQRQEANGISARNVELTHLLVEYQKRLRESSDFTNTAEEKSRKLTMEVSVLKHEKEILVSSEKRASEEIHGLLERVHRLQVSLDTLQSVEEGREGERSKERMRLEQYVQQVERNWAEAVKELQAERDRVRLLEKEKESTLDNSMRQVAEAGKELADAWKAVASAEGRATASEVRCHELEKKISLIEMKMGPRSTGEGDTSLSAEPFEDLRKVKVDMEKIKEEAQANKDYMLQYKEIAMANETALKQMETAHEEYKTESEKLKKVLENEILSLRGRVSELEISCVSKSEEITKAIEDKEKAMSSALIETAGLREELSEKLSQIAFLQNQVSSLRNELDQEHRRWRTSQDNYERQVILQSESIQELTSTSEKLSVVQAEFLEFRRLSEAYKVEMEMFKVSWEKEKSVLQELKDEAVCKYKEMNEQNRILHDRLESLHIKMVATENNLSGFSTTGVDSSADNGVQNVIGYLRRSKEIAETEITLLKQEKLRLQSQLESSIKAAETAQALLQSHRENSRENILKDEEFKSLQIQVHEINLLRESNMQLREENKHNFEESQKLREEFKALKVDAELMTDLVRRRDLEIDALNKEAEVQNLEKIQLEARIAELLDNSKSIDAADYERIKDEVQQVKMQLEQMEMLLQQTRAIVSEKQELVSDLEQELAKCRLDLAAKEKKLNEAQQAHVIAKEENEKQKRVLNSLKRKNEFLMKEKEGMMKEKEGMVKEKESMMKEKEGMMKEKEILIKEKEDLNKEKPRLENDMKEKDVRLQTLEKTLEREREEHKREKSRRYKIEQTMLDQYKNVAQKRDKVNDELLKHKKAVQSAMENTGISIPTALDEHASAYFKSVDTLEAAVKSVTEGPGVQTSTDSLPPADASVDPAASQISIQQVRPEGTDEREKKLGAPQQVRKHTVQGPSPPLPLRQEGVDEKEKRLASAEVRRPGRRLIRPRLERVEEVAADTELPTVEGTTVEETRASLQEIELQGDVPPIQKPSVRKRLAPQAAPETKEIVVAQDYDGPVSSSEPPLKKVRDSENEEPLVPATSESVELKVESDYPPDDMDTQIHAEELEGGQPSSLPTEDIFSVEEVDVAREETEKLMKMETDESNQESIPLYEEDPTLEELTKAVISEFLDDSLQTEAIEILQPAAEESDREEGELPDDVDLQGRDDVAGHQEPTQSEAVGAGNEVGDDVEAASSELSSEAKEISEAGKAITEREPSPQPSPFSTRDYSPHPASSLVTRDQSHQPSSSSFAREQSPQPSTSTPRDGSPGNLQHSVTAEETTSSPAVESEEPRGRTITISEMAKRNAALRQARLAQAARGRGSTARGRGAQGGRGGRQG